MDLFPELIYKIGFLFGKILLGLLGIFVGGFIVYYVGRLFGLGMAKSLKEMFTNRKEYKDGKRPR